MNVETAKASSNPYDPEEYKKKKCPHCTDSKKRNKPSYNRHVARNHPNGKSFDEV